MFRPLLQSELPPLPLPERRLFRAVRNGRLESANHPSHEDAVAYVVGTNLGAWPADCRIIEMGAFGRADDARRRTELAIQEQVYAWGNVIERADRAARSGRPGPILPDISDEQYYAQIGRTRAAALFNRDALLAALVVYAETDTPEWPVLALTEPAA